MAGALVRRFIPSHSNEIEIEKFTSNLAAVEQVLLGFEESEVRETHILPWLDELRDLKCDMEDVVDEWNTALLKSKVAKEYGSSSNKVRFSSCFCSSHVIRVGQHPHIVSKMRNLTEKLKSVDHTKYIFTKYRFDNSEQGRKVDVPQRRETSSFVDIRSVYGRDVDRDIIVKTLLSWSCVVPDVVAIVGMGGLGKTTVAQLAYDDKGVDANFDMRIWVCVSTPFDVIRVAITILEAVSNYTYDDIMEYGRVELDILFDSIRRYISGQKFLLVLDDVWNEDSSWELLMEPFCYGAAGSKILVTTRSETVATIIGATSVIRLEVLSEEDGWSLFRKSAGLSDKVSDCEQYEEIGRKLASLCFGLPLALKVLGSFLQYKRTKEEWLSVLNSEVWNMKSENTRIQDILQLSYNNLNAYLRRCFSYCSIFPHDYPIETDSLIKMWMSQGFLDSKSMVEMELLGQTYVMDLVSRSIFQVLEKDYRGKVIRCMMHDLLHDFVRHVTKHECFLTVVSDGTAEMMPVLEKPRHGTFVLAAGDIIPISTCNGDTLRTAFFLCSTNTAITHDVFVHLKCLRTLNLRDFWFKELPKEIGEFLHLRYLNLSGNDELKTLPETLCELSNLQTLLLSNCMQLEKLPDHMEKLVSLRHLHVDGCFNLSALPKGIAKLTFLRTLDMLVVPLSDNLEAFQLEDIKKLNKVEGYLRICRCGNLTNVQEAKNAQLFCRSQILDLNLDFSWSEGRTLDDEIVLEAVSPHPNLESLEIRKYRGTTISPHWLMCLNNLRRLVLYSCQYCETLPPLGKLASLESLKICLMKGVKKVGLEFLGIETDGVENSSFVSFPKLRELGFTELSNWKVWEGSAGFTEEHDSAAIMPLLNSLEIDSCFLLQVLPDFLKMTRLQNLTVTEGEILQEHCKEGTGNEWVKISHIPNIKFLKI